MRASFAGIAMAGLMLLAGVGSTAAQDVRVSLSWGTDDVRASAYYGSQGVRVVDYDRDVRYVPRAPRPIVRRHYAECVAEGPYLYCWDTPRFHHARPVVHVYVTDRAAVRRHHSRGRGWERQWERRHHRAAMRYWRRWADAHRYRYDRDRLIVDFAFAW